jgi:adenylate cyclase
MQAERSIATILFTDIVGSTERAAELGDRGWRGLLERHHDLVRRALQRFSGDEISTAGDSFLALFDGAERAILCACAIRDNVREIGLEIRCGLHMGEVEREAGGDVGGIAVHVGARVLAQAEAGEVLVTSGVQEAALGSGFGFEDRGQHELKGVPGRWTLYAITNMPTESSESLRDSVVLHSSAPKAKTEKSIAVLAFANMSADPENEFFSDGVSEELINRLTKLPQLRVSSRTSSFSFKNKNLNARTIAEELGVKTILEGSVRRAENRIRITAQLIDTTSDSHLWSETYDRELEDIFAVQDEIAQNIVDALQITLSPKVKRVIERMPSTNVEAYDCYLRGLGFFYQYLHTNLNLAEEMFSKAVEIDPEYAPAYAGIAMCAVHIYQWHDKNERHVERADAASLRAVELDPELAEAHASRGVVLALKGCHDEAEKEFETAISIDATLFEAYYFYARTAFTQGKLEKAARLYEQASEARPDDYQAPLLVVQVYISLGMEREAREAVERGFKIAEKHVKLNPNDRRALELGAGALVRMGQMERGLEWLERARALGPHDVYNIACTYAVAGEVDKALDCLEGLIAEDQVFRAWLENDSDFDAMRTHPRFEALMERL